MADIALLNDIFSVDRLGKTRPTTVTVELIQRSNQGFTRNHVHVETWYFVVPIEGLERGVPSRYAASPRTALEKVVR